MEGTQVDRLFSKQRNGCQVPGFPQWVPGCGAQGMQGGAHGVMTGVAGCPGGVGNAFTAYAGNLVGVRAELSW